MFSFNKTWLNINVKPECLKHINFICYFSSYIVDIFPSCNERIEPFIFKAVIAEIKIVTLYRLFHRASNSQSVAHCSLVTISTKFNKSFTKKITSLCIYTWECNLMVITCIKRNILAQCYPSIRSNISHKQSSLIGEQVSPLPYSLNQASFARVILSPTTVAGTVV